MPPDKTAPSDMRTTAVVFLYAGAVALLFSRFFWLAPFSMVGLVTLVLTAACFHATLRDPAAGLLLLSVLTPLTGSLHHMAPERCPAPLLLIAGGFALGWWLHRRRGAEAYHPQPAPGSEPAFYFFLLALVSGVLTAWRYLDFAPFGDWPGLGAPVNVNYETVREAVGDIWHVTVVWMAGPLLFLTVTQTQRPEGWLGRWARFFIGAVVCAWLVGVAQILFWPSLGNAAYWVERNRINATFTDPNGLGTFAALVFPLAVAVGLLSARRGDRLLGGAAIVLSFIMLASAGSRTGAAGLVVALLLFPAVAALRFRQEGPEFRQRAVFAALLLLILFCAFAPRRQTAGETIPWPLMDRLAATRELMAREGIMAPLLRDRWPLWEPAAYVAGRYPVAGIGLGAFRYEVDNISRLDLRDWQWLDNANNFYIHTVSELGAVGLAVVLAALLAIARAIVRTLRRADLPSDERVLYPAMAIGWLGMLVLLTTALWLAFPQIQIVFWLFAAFFATQPESRSDRPPLVPARWRHFIAIGAIAVVAIVQLAHGFGRLEPDRRRRVLQLEESAGFYAWETDETGRRYRWIGEKATITVPTTRAMIRVLVRARHPDLAQNPVPVWFTLGGNLAANRYIKTGDWQWIAFEVPEGVPDPATLAIHVERTWNAEGDPRPIGIAVARVENIDAAPAAPPQ